MTQPRSQLIAIEDTPYYHITSRCVRRAFLCGNDSATGKSYEHRRKWIEDRIRILSSIFAIDICSYAVLSNHLHIVVKLMPQEAERWSNLDVLERWTSLYKGPLLVQRWLAKEKLTTAEDEAVTACIAVYRERLSNISWLMKCLNEPIARQANKEDNCTGHFWESRFNSQALLTEEALLTCMAYVDLNPIRACMATTPETSDHTSIKERIAPTLNLEDAITEQIKQQCLQKFELPIKPLASFEGNTTEYKQDGILFSIKDYLQLVDVTGKIIREDKRGGIPLHLSPILERLSISHGDWLNQATQFEKIYQRKFARKRRRREQIA